jgi:glycosyltransferase involved in cell wall biosynthesis
MNNEKNRVTKIGIVFPKNSSAIFDPSSSETYGGATVQMYLIAEELAKHTKTDVTSLVVSFGLNDGDIISGFKIQNTFTKNDYFALRTIKFHKAIMKAKPEVIIQHGLTVYSCLLAVYCKLMKIKFVYMFAHDVEAEGYYQTSRKKASLFKLLIKYTDIIITQNKHQHDILLNSVNRNSIILYNGFPIISLPPVKKEHILWVARCDKWKCPEKFIRLASLNKNYKFVMVCNESTNEKHYLQIKTMANIVDNLHFLSHVPTDQMEDIFQKSLLLVNTSDDEGFPQVFIQAAICKTPIISLNVNPDNFITKYECGIYCAGDECTMNESIDSLLRNKQKYNEFSNNAFDYAKENHDIKLNVKKLLDLFQSSTNKEDIPDEL